MTVRRLGAVGTLVWDRVIHPSTAGAPVEQWGGMAYSLSALSAACAPGWVVEPLLKLGADMAEPARALLGRFPRVETGEGVRTVPEAMNRVELTYTDGAHRGERLTGGVPGWDARELEPLLTRFDALYLNFISGFEIDLATAARIRAVFPGPIYADLHSLFLGCPGAGIRKPRALPEWREWVACFDAVQVNENELALLSGGQDPERFAMNLLDHGPGLVVTTRGARGATVHAREGRLWRGADGERLALDLPLASEPRDGDPTGCGDVWGSTFFMGLLEGRSPRGAGERAHRMAAATIDTRSTDDLPRRLRALLEVPAPA